MKLKNIQASLFLMNIFVSQNLPFSENTQDFFITAGLDDDDISQFLFQHYPQYPIILESYYLDVDEKTGRERISLLLKKLTK